MLSYSLLPKPKEVDKIPQCCPHPDYFQAGDILIFNINHNQTNHTTIAQKMYNNQGGHKEAVHVAFVVEIEGEKKIAHLRSRGFVVSEINTLITVVHIYRPRIYQAEIARELNHLIQENQDKFKHKLHWRITTSIRLFFGRLIHAVGIKSDDIQYRKDSQKTLPTSEHFISSWSICSKFLAQAYVVSCNAITEGSDVDVRSLLMNITSNTLPKTLQAYFAIDENQKELALPFYIFLLTCF